MGHLLQGITRLAFLEIGKRLHARGLLPDPMHVMEGHPEALCRMLLVPGTVDAPALAKEVEKTRDLP